MADDFARMAYPNESHAYRLTRNALLDAEIALRRRPRRRGRPRLLDIAERLAYPLLRSRGEGNSQPW